MRIVTENMKCGKRTSRISRPNSTNSKLPFHRLLLHARHFQNSLISTHLITAIIIIVFITISFSAHMIKCVHIPTPTTQSFQTN